MQKYKKCIRESQETEKSRLNKVKKAVLCDALYRVDKDFFEHPFFAGNIERVVECKRAELEKPVNSL